MTNWGKRQIGWQWRKQSQNAIVKYPTVIWLLLWYVKRRVLKFRLGTQTAPLNCLMGCSNWIINQGLILCFINLSRGGKRHNIVFTLLFQQMLNSVHVVLCLMLTQAIDQTSWTKCWTDWTKIARDGLYSVQRLKSFNSLSNGSYKICWSTVVVLFTCVTSLKLLFVNRSYERQKVEFVGTLYLF